MSSDACVGLLACWGGHEGDLMRGLVATWGDGDVERASIRYVGEYAPGGGMVHAISVLG